MNTILEQLNSTGKAFVEFAGPMLIQSCVLIAVLLSADLVLRKKVRAVFRYWLWMLVLAKLVLPVTLSAPVSVGSLFEPLSNIKAVSPIVTAKPTEIAQPMELPGHAETTAPMSSEPAAAAVSGPAISWQGAMFLVWLMVVMVMGLLLLQRAIFVKGLVAQAGDANNLMVEALQFCRRQIGVRTAVGLKVSANAASPAVCGLWRTVILVPQNLAPSLGPGSLRVVLLHELAHIKRGDLWVNLTQTVLQIIYFYNPLLWVANAVIRRLREQAVDEAVQVAMGEKAQQYPQTLVEVAKLAFKRPTLSLRLLGVVESKGTLQARVKRMLNRPIPKTAKLGLAGLIAIIVTGAVLLPMAKAASKPPEFVIKGTVTDAKTGKPIAGAKVGDVEKYAEGKQWTITDSNGNYEYKTWYEEHAVKCEIAGYETQIKGFLPKLFGLDLEKERVVDFELTHGETAEQSEFKATLPNGVIVELVGVCDYPDGKARCWMADGSELEKQVYVKREGDYSDGKYGFIVKVSGPEDLSFAWNKIEVSKGYWGSCTVIDDKGNKLDGFQAAITKGANGRETTNIRIGIATGLWEPEAISSGANMTTSGNKDALFSQAYESDNFVGITVSSSWRKDKVERIVAIDNEGKVHTTKNTGSVASGEIDQITAKFYDVKLKDIREFQFQTRPYKWAEFKNISLKPNFKTDVQVGVEKDKGQEPEVSSQNKTGEAGQVEKIEPKVKSVFEQIDGQVIKFIGDTYGQTAAEAESKHLYANSHIYYVDPNFVLYRGGMNYYYNQTGRTITGRVRLTGTSYPDQTLYDVTGQKLNTEIVHSENRPNHWQIYWIPDEPLAQGESLYYGWSIDDSRSLPSKTGQAATLTMQNQFGSPVIETFFLVLPKELEISQSNPPTGSEKLLNFDIYWWTKTVQQGENHLERVQLNKVPEIVGKWQSVDFVSSPDQFQPGIQQWKGELFLKEITFNSDGSSSKPWRWKDGWIHEIDGNAKAQYYIKRIDGEKYLFFPWLSGDVTSRGQKPKYYVLKAVAVETSENTRIQIMRDNRRQALENPGIIIKVARELFDKIKNADYDYFLNSENKDVWEQFPIVGYYNSYKDYPLLVNWICETFKRNPIVKIELNDISISEPEEWPRVYYKLTLKDGAVIEGDLHFEYHFYHGDEQGRWYGIHGHFYEGPETPYKMHGLDWHLQSKPVISGAAKGPGENQQKIRVAVDSAKRWLELVDAGDYDKSWQQAAEFFKNALPKKQWDIALKISREPLGKLLSRELVSTVYATELPGAPDGEYVVITFKTAYENKNMALEQVTPMLDKDGKWRVSGYYIR